MPLRYRDPAQPVWSATKYPNPRQILYHRPPPRGLFSCISEHDNLSLTHAEGLFGICIQGALNAVCVRKNDISASSVRLHEGALDFDKSLEDGADVDLDGVR
jgi:hypothetical protein